MAVYKTWNAAMPTTAAQAAVTTGTAIKTMLQLSTPATRDITIISWGFTSSEDETGIVELIQTDVAATVTAHVAAGVQPQNPGSPASLLTLGVANTGFTATAEGAITATRTFDAVAMGDISTDEGFTYRYQFMPDERPVVPISKFLRVRATFGTAVNLRTWICWDE